MKGEVFVTAFWPDSAAGISGVSHSPSQLALLARPCRQPKGQSPLFGCSHSPELHLPREGGPDEAYQRRQRWWGGWSPSEDPPFPGRQNKFRMYFSCFLVEMFTCNRRQHECHNTFGAFNDPIGPLCFWEWSKNIGYDKMSKFEFMVVWLFFLSTGFKWQINTSDIWINVLEICIKNCTHFKTINKHLAPHWSKSSKLYW